MIENCSLIDTNILIYAYDSDEGAKNSIASKLLEKIMMNKMNIALSTQNLSEFFVNVTKKIERPLSVDLAKKNIADWASLSNIKILEINASNVLDAINISADFNIGYWDSLIASVMHANNINIIITENEKDFKKIPWIKVINPFRK